MKKLLVVLGIVAFGFTFTSCKKECVCKVAGVKMPFTGKVIDSKEDCKEWEELSKDTGLKCEWK